MVVEAAGGRASVVAPGSYVPVVACIVEVGVVENIGKVLVVNVELVACMASVEKVYILGVVMVAVACILVVAFAEAGMASVQDVCILVAAACILEATVVEACMASAAKVYI